MTVRRIVVGTEGSSGGQAAVVWAGELAVQTGATLTVVHAFEPLALLGKVPPPYDMPAVARRQRELLDTTWCAPLRELGLQPATAFVEDTPLDALVAVADRLDADLIVVGARAQSSLRGLLLGSTSLRLPHETSRPVCVVHDPLSRP